jgi:pimeloyl-ACP methyl ester carboxylesterase
MTEYTHQTAPTQFIETGGIRFAYRRFGRAGGRVPVVFFNHFRGNLETFDPAITNGFATDREVVVFDNAGVGASTGTPRDTVPGIAADAETFLDALGLDQIDLLGHSMGGEWAQLVALGRPALVRRLVLVGTGPRGGEGMAAQRPETAALFGKTYERQDEMWLPIFFSPSAASQQAGWAYLNRTRARQQDRDLPVSAETALAHRAAAADWGQPAQDGFGYLEKITQPTLVVNGHTDIVIATVNSFILQQHIPSAQLILYPDSGHGAHFQYPQLFLAQTRLFLDG